ncbi:DUF6891 domain-containing protein [Stackebrandtia nassauensis]|uniref:DUF6891 domain-containing protein n=1 Tax=Stackebrandtia nassauensis (strain DSM 44728 / CIP 108903 / NRRL B-16338 / NBRC 102104 / LLR-40K-21) TaxID=446470 RepID=D3PZJ8_STANL|nr:hypothetical protein [Stackebrandtia nassauensis]ADD41672.1 conserved hypothetical protein [Stackebrandtia nassauensis DSM 44728]
MNSPEAEDVPPLDDKKTAYIRQYAQEIIDEGFTTFAELTQDVWEGVEDEFPHAEELDEEPITEAQVTALLKPMWRDRLAEQESWPAVTDVDRLTAVFDRLDASGVTARMNFSCCMTCGPGEIRGEAAEGDHGYVFFHSQDTARAVDGDLLLAYGTYSRDPEHGAAVGREVVAALTEAGFTTEWNGSVKHRIAVTGLDWKKRLP